MDDALIERLVERFYRYVAIPTQSDARAAKVPSTPGQWDLARLLHGELTALGLEEVHLDTHCVLTARLPASDDRKPRIGFCAHLDTVDVGLSPVIRPQRVRLDGKDVCLNRERAVWLRMDEHPDYAAYRGQEVLLSDGTSVLGADNKAAIAVIMELLAELVATRVPHGDVVVAFVPDEEIGLRGARSLDLARFPVDWAYTIDACAVGEFVYETFNAAQASIVIEGVTAHPMTAKGVLVNPILVAHDVIARLDPRDTPECTQGRDGYVWVNAMTADQASARLSVSIRDFDRAAFEGRKATLLEAVAATQAAFPRAHVTCTITDVYANIASCMGEDRRSVDQLRTAFAQAGITPKIIPMRGGTDGSALSVRGIPTPNFFTGALNFHSVFECLPLTSFGASYAVARALVVE
ncbi:peptidase T [Ameyamaea chiangmaiensis NBRC 103196]|uniref:Peptidase T n=1 Tax=Ameyamaea chiangmaiensis TaxID=442969 RepID=A0A850PCG5_9PROT|nr:peptidase T [Ameyamaea chiangmaiensis]NVN40210.1 peptidase T [Ameyamaea chiangmaiensis]GBQ66277.1 peptidase T [Ameyamaea chiangmaiensis NBRC 103196]